MIETLPKSYQTEAMLKAIRHRRLIDTQVRLYKKCHERGEHPLLSPCNNCRQESTCTNIGLGSSTGCSRLDDQIVAIGGLS
jgi:hypothetical protein